MSAMEQPESLSPKERQRPAEQYGAETALPDDGKMRLLDAINRQICCSSRLTETVEQIVQTTQVALRAEASSLLLLNESGDELYFQVAEGSVSRQLKRITVDVKSGVAGWVATHLKPVIVNNAASDSRFTGETDRSTGFETRSLMCVPLVVSNRLIGVLEVLNELDGSGFCEHDMECLQAVASSAAIAIDNTRLQHSVEEGYKATIRSLAAAVDAKDPYTSGHSLAVMEYSVMAGVALGLPKTELDTLEYGAILHDVGKIGIDDWILRKPAGLTPQERLVIQEHPVIGAAIVKDIPFLRNARQLVLHHHERLDGSGYPDHLEGEDIPLGARILAVADAFDTMTTDRPYRKALSLSDALLELSRCSGTQFWPQAVDSFQLGLSSRNRSSESAGEDTFRHTSSLHLSPFRRDGITGAVANPIHGSVVESHFALAR